MYLQHVGGQANRPGVSIKGLRFAGVPSEPATETKKAKASPNADLFKEGEGHAQLEVQNVTKDVAAEFEEGKVYIVDIREAGPND